MFGAVQVFVCFHFNTYVCPYYLFCLVKVLLLFNMYTYTSLLLGLEDGIWDIIVLVHVHCIFFYFFYYTDIRKNILRIHKEQTQVKWNIRVNTLSENESSNMH